MAIENDGDVPIEERVVRAVQDNPYQALAAAAGVGLLVGGGLGGRLLGGALEAAGRVAGALLLSQVLGESGGEGDEHEVSERESRVRARPPF